MRRDAVETYKQELVKKIESRILQIEGPNHDNKLSMREMGRVRGLVDFKMILQSHEIKVL
jgi:hypothetical protein